MTRKHFKALADMVASLPADTTRHEVVYKLASALRTTNPNFDYGRFVAACEPKEHK